jgi:membrane-associated protease RseP (regulator of RpoE activity)
MNPKSLAGGWPCFAVAIFLSGVPWSPAAADEPAANKPATNKPVADDQARPSPGTTIDYGFPVEGARGWTQVALDTFYVATNSDLMGADVAQVDDVLRSHLGLGEGKGLVVTAVGDDSPAAKAGLQKNDVLITVGGQEIAGADALRTSLEASAEKPIAVGFIRAGKKQSVDVTPKSTTTRLILNTVNQVAAEPRYWLGVGLAGADDTLRSQLAVPAGEGLVVTSVETDSPAAKAGVMVNDVLLKLDGKSSTTIEALTEQLQTIADKSVGLELLRRGKPATLTVTPEKRAETWQTVGFLDGGIRDAIVYVAPQRLQLETAFTGTLGTEALNVTFTQAKPDLARQLSELEAQVKQLETSLAALRAAIAPPAPAAQGGGEKKEEK